MAKSMITSLLAAVSLLAFAPMLCFSMNYKAGAYLFPQFYDRSCPRAQKIVRSVVEKAWAKDQRMAASLIRLMFHDCFVQGCDASLLLDSSGVFWSEKRAKPNRDSARGFEVIDEIKSALEKECPMTVSCADIIQIAARDSVVLAGGPNWEVPLGRRDSTTACYNGARNNLPSPNNMLNTILNLFKRQGLNLVDLVTLAGAHTIGNSKCVFFKPRLYNQTGDGKPDATLDPSYAKQLRSRCPSSGGDNNMYYLDKSTPFYFDNGYYKNLVASTGLLNSDQVLYTQNEQSREIVKTYAGSKEAFFH